MTKHEAIKQFMAFELSTTDKVANREMWNNWTDSLCKDGIITEHQYNTWTYPRNKYFY